MLGRKTATSVPNIFFSFIVWTGYNGRIHKINNDDVYVHISIPGKVNTNIHTHTNVMYIYDARILVMILYLHI